MDETGYEAVQPIGRARALVFVLAGVDLATLPDSRVMDAVVELSAGLGALHGELLRLVAEADARDVSRGEGAVSTAAWLRAATRVSPRVALRMVRTAQGLETAPAAVEALRDGIVGVGHVEVVVDTVAALDAQKMLTDDTRADVVDALVDASRRHDVPAVQKVATRVRHLLDPECLNRDAVRQHEERHLTCAATIDGVHLRGLLPLGTGQVVLAALGALSAPQPTTEHGPDPRSPGQRRADALVELAQRATTAGQLGRVMGVRPHISLLVPVHALDPEETSEPATSVNGDALGSADTLAITCDAAVRRVTVPAPGGAPGERGALARVLEAASHVLDVGRTTRTIPAAIRAALLVRDKHCRFPGCDRPGLWLDAHHIVHWAHGGATSLANLVLLCGRYHALIHRHPDDWLIEPQPTGPPVVRSRHLIRRE